MNEKYFIIIFFFLVSLTGLAQIEVEASETVELMAILSRTACFREYCMDMGGQYTKDTEAWFAPYKQHPAAVYMKDLRSKCNMGYDAVMTMAINLETDGKTGKAFENGTDYAATLIHEFNHSFINPLYDANTDQFGTIGEKLLKRYYRGMSNQAYRNAAIVINESIVRAAVIIYMQENGFSDEQIKAEMYEQIARDFLWMPELVTALRHYSKHRIRYKTLDDYYPEIAKCLENYLKVETERIESAL